VKPEPARAPDIKLYLGMVPRSFHVTVKAGEVLNLTNSDVTAPVYDDGIAVGALEVEKGRRSEWPSQGHDHSSAV
jgi:hypothetical protein